MKSLYFENSNKKRVLVKENIDDDSFYYDIAEDVASRSGGEFRIFYYRSWQNPENEKETVIDVGSHSEYYIIAES